MKSNNDELWEKIKKGIGIKENIFEEDKMKLKIKFTQIDHILIVEVLDSKGIIGEDLMYSIPNKIGPGFTIKTGEHGCFEDWNTMRLSFLNSEDKQVFLYEYGSAGCATEAREMFTKIIKKINEKKIEEPPVANEPLKIEEFIVE